MEITIMLRTPQLLLCLSCILSASCAQNTLDSRQNLNAPPASSAWLAPTFEREVPIYVPGNNKTPAYILTERSPAGSIHRQKYQQEERKRMHDAIRQETIRVRGCVDNSTDCGRPVGW